MTDATWKLVHDGGTYPVPSFEVPYIQVHLDAAAAGGTDHFVEFVPQDQPEKVRLRITASTHLISPTGYIV